jgi:hypothetical protein
VEVVGAVGGPCRCRCGGARLVVFEERCAADQDGDERRKPQLVGIRGDRADAVYRREGTLGPADRELFVVGCFAAAASVRKREQDQ